MKMTLSSFTNDRSHVVTCFSRFDEEKGRVLAWIGNELEIEGLTERETAPLPISEGVVA